MDYSKIRELLRKYWEGETDIEEERQLKAFFSQATELPEDLEKERSLFGYFKKESSLTTKEDLTGKLKQHWAEHKKTPVKSINAWKQFLKYAAVLIPLVLLGYFLININRNAQEKLVQTRNDTFDDPKKAIAETEKALLLLSQNMNDGMAKIETFKLFDDVKNSEKFKQQNRSTKK